MAILLLQSIAFLLQLIAAVLALLLIPLTGKKLAWIIISLGLTLVLVRRLALFAYILGLSPSELANHHELLFESLLMLAISVFFIVGMALIRPLFLSMKAKDDEMREKQRFIQQITDTTPDQIYIIDVLNRRVTYMSSQSVEFFGLTPDEAYKMGPDFFQETFHPDDLPKFFQASKRFTEVQDGEVIQNEYRTKRADGSWRSLRTRSLVFDRMPDGTTKQIIGTAEDITDQKISEQKEKELEQHMRDFYRRTILAATEGKLVVSDLEEIESLGGVLLACFELERGEDLAAIRKSVAEIARSAGMDESRIFDFVLCVGEATTNALKHAGGKTSSIRLFKLDDSLMFVVSDDGPGIDALDLPQVALKKGYTTAHSLGMGYKAMISVADTVYLATGPDGTTVAVKMGLKPVSAATERQALPQIW